MNLQKKIIVSLALVAIYFGGAIVWYNRALFAIKADLSAQPPVSVDAPANNAEIKQSMVQTNGLTNFFNWTPPIGALPNFYQLLVSRNQNFPDGGTAAFYFNKSGSLVAQIGSLSEPSVSYFPNVTKLIFNWAQNVSTGHQLVFYFSDSANFENYYYTTNIRDNQTIVDANNLNSSLTPKNNTTNFKIQKDGAYYWAVLEQAKIGDYSDSGATKIVAAQPFKFVYDLTSANAVDLTCSNSDAVSSAKAFYDYENSQIKIKLDLAGGAWVTANLGGMGADKNNTSFFRQGGDQTISWPMGLSDLGNPLGVYNLKVDIKKIWTLQTETGCSGEIPIIFYLPTGSGQTSMNDHSGSFLFQKAFAAGATAFNISKDDVAKFKLDQPMNYYFKVRFATDAGFDPANPMKNNWGNFSETRAYSVVDDRVSTVIEAPTILNISDAQGGLVDLASAKLIEGEKYTVNWSSIAGAKKYQLALFIGADSDPKNGSCFPALSSSSNSFINTDFLSQRAPGQYKLAVRATNLDDPSSSCGIANNWSGFGKFLNFSLVGAKAIENVVSEKPIIITANNQSIKVGDTINIAWASLTNAKTYQMQIATDDQFSDNLQTFYFNDTIQGYDLREDLDSKYFVRLRASSLLFPLADLDNSYWGLWSNNLSFNNISDAAQTTTPPNISPPTAQATNTVANQPITFSGTFKPGFPVKVTVDSLSCSASAGTDGKWSCVIQEGLVAGNHEAMVVGTYNDKDYSAKLLFTVAPSATSVVPLSKDGAVAGSPTAVAGSTAKKTGIGALPKAGANLWLNLAIALLLSAITTYLIFRPWKKKPADVH